MSREGGSVSVSMFCQINALNFVDSLASESDLAEAKHIWPYRPAAVGLIFALAVGIAVLYPGMLGILQFGDHIRIISPFFQSSLVCIVELRVHVFSNLDETLARVERCATTLIFFLI